MPATAQIYPDNDKVPQMNRRINTRGMRPVYK